MKLKQDMSGSYLKSFLIRIKHLLRKDYVIGFDLGMEKLNMVQVGYHSNNQPYIHATASDYHNIDLNDLLANLDSLKKLVKNSLQSRKFTGRKVVSSIPAHYLKILFLNYQVGKSENDIDSLLLSLKKRINGDLNDYVIDYIPIKPDAIERNDRMALVAMAKQNIVEQYLDFLADCGLEVVALEIGPVAIRRLVNALTASDEKQKVLTINFGTKISYLTVIWNNELLFDRKLDFGFETIISVIAKGFDVSVQTAFEILHKYGLDDAKRAVLSDSDNIEDIDNSENDNSIKNAIYDVVNPSFVNLASEIRDIMVYIASETRGGAVEQIFLMGSLARLSGIDLVIDKLISIPVKILNPFYGIEVENASNTLHDLGPVAGVAVATGLALRGH
jgi:type IV pilus assembly protein PilM